MNVYLYPSNTETELKNAYIGEYIGPYTPTSNTMAYFPLINDTLDHSGNNRTLVEQASGTATKQNIGYLFNGSLEIASIGATAKFVSAWIKVVTQGSSTISLLGMGGGYFAYQYKESGYDQQGGANGHVKKAFLVRSGTFYRPNNYYNTTSGTWYNMACGYDNSHAVFYINGEVYWDTTYIPTPPANSEFGIVTWYGSTHDNLSSCILSDVIIEDTLRDTTKYQDYYNANKGIYGL